MIKLVGAILIVGAAGGVGFGKAFRIHRQIQQLGQMLAAIEILKCELNYTLRPFPQLCIHAAQRTNGAVAAFLQAFAERLEKGMPRAKAATVTMEETRALILPNDAKMAVLELCSTLGRYDIDGENRLLQLTGQRLRSALERFEREKKPLVKSYAVLGVTAGIALVILFL